MTTLAAVFSSETGLDDTLEKLYAHDLDSDNITVIRNGEENAVADGNTPVVPVAAHGGQATTQSPTVGAYAIGYLPDFDLDPEQEQFYSNLQNDGATLLFIDLDDIDASREQIENAIEGASRVDVID